MPPLIQYSVVASGDQAIHEIFLVEAPLTQVSPMSSSGQALHAAKRGASNRTKVTRRRGVRNGMPVKNAASGPGVAVRILARKGGVAAPVVRNRTPIWSPVWRYSDHSGMPSFTPRPGLAFLLTISFLSMISLPVSASERILRVMRRADLSGVEADRDERGDSVATWLPRRPGRERFARAGDGSARNDPNRSEPPETPQLSMQVRGMPRFTSKRLGTVQFPMGSLSLSSGFAPLRER